MESSHSFHQAITHVILGILLQMLQGHVFSEAIIERSSPFHSSFTVPKKKNLVKIKC